MIYIQLKRQLSFCFVLIFIILFDLFTIVFAIHKPHLAVFDKPNLKPENNVSFRPKNKLKDYSSESSDTSIWSNAMNFKQTWGSAVDPRTGIFTAHIKAGSLLSNLGHGPNIDLEASYNSISVANKDNIGFGWQWNLTRFNPATNQLVTAGGKNFYLKQDNSGKWRPRYHKLHDISISGDKKTHFIITYVNGLREILSHEGYETTLMQQDGNCVHFLYIPGTHQLQNITDDHNNSIQLNWKKNQITISSRGYNGKSIKVIFKKENNELRNATLLSMSKQNSLGLYIHYTGHLITKIDYPTGLKKIVTYNCVDAIKKPAPSKDALCAVNREITAPGAGQPAIVMRYNYMQVSADKHDYLGFNAGLITDNLHKDTLFEAPSDYTYKTSADNGLIKEIRTYNKYHLLIDSQQISDRTGNILSKVHYFFCNINQSNGCAHTSFFRLPVTYSFPLKIVSKVWGNHTGTPAVSSVTAKYDDFGRITDHTDSFGRLTHTDYCPVSGDAACPAPSHGWSFNTLPERVIQYPAANQDGEKSVLPPVITYNFYQKEFNRNGSGYLLKLKQQIIKSREQYTLTTRNYYHNINNILNYGLLRQITMTGTTPSASALKYITRRYYYKQSADGNYKITYSTIDSGQVKTEHSSQTVTSLFTNQTVSITDSSGNNTVCYHYDSLGRLIQTEKINATSASFSTYYHYLVNPEHNEVQLLPASGLRHKIIFDGAGRAIKFFDSAINATGKIKPGFWQLKKTNYFDTHGRLTTEHSYYFDTSGHIKTLMVTRDYDDFGRLLQVHTPNGITRITQYDDPHLCMLSYQQDQFGNRSVISVVKTTASGQPVKQTILPVTKKALPLIQYLCTHSDKVAEAKTTITQYDGFGRVTLIKDHQNKIIKQHYDALGHLISVIDPAGNQVQLVTDLAGHVIQQWSLPISGGRYLLFSAGYNALGQRLWQAAEDGNKTLFTYTKSGKLSSARTPSGHILSWQYNLSDLPVAKYLDNKLQLKINYDPLTMLPVRKEDISGVSIYTYGDDELLQTIVHNGKKGYPLDYRLFCEYDNNRRLISQNDISGNKIQIYYDKLGRIITTRYQPKKGPAETLIASVYDGFSRVTNVHYGSNMHRSITYDNWGHADNVTDTLGGKLLSQWKFSYDSSNNMTTLLYKADHHQYGLLHYQYDLAGNLKKMTCTGSTNLPLCPREANISGSLLQKAPVITQQNYTFTPLKKLAKADEILYDSQQNKTITKTINYNYFNFFAPLRPKQISISWNDQPPRVHPLSYDLCGNMIIDGENKITYNAFNQITDVITPEGKQNHYTYGSSGQKIIEQNKVGKSYFVYRNGHLINTMINSTGSKSHIIGYQLVAKSVNNIIDEYYESNYKGDVTAVLKKTNNTNNQYQLSVRNLYSPYGMIWHQKSAPLPLYQQNLVGFNGERTDPVTGWQFLGPEQRAYNSQYRLFFTEDPLTGGYSFGNNNPIMHNDPSGNMPEWVGTTFKWMGYISTFGLSAIHQRWANIAGSAIMAGMAFASLGLAVADAGSSALFTAITAGAAISSAVPVAAASLPPNKGLDITAAVIGATTALIVTATSVALLGLSLFSALSSAEIPDSTQCLGCVSEGLMSSKMHQEFEQGSSIQSILNNISPSKDLMNYLHSDEWVKFSIINDNIHICTTMFVQRLWNILLAFEKDNPGSIGCDSLTILLAAKFSGKPLKLKNYISFLNARVLTQKDTLLAIEHPYEKALQQVLSQFGEYIPLYNGTIPVSKVFTKPGQAAIIRSTNHMNLVQLGFDSNPGDINAMWNFYTLNENGNIIGVSGQLKDIDCSLFLDENGDFRVIGYLSLN